MKFSLISINLITISSYVVSALALLLIYATLGGKRLPLVSSDKAAFFILGLLGFSMSILAGLRDYPDGKFTMPGLLLTVLMILGFLAGALILLKLTGLAGIKLSGIISYRQAINLMAGIIMVKWILVHLYKLGCLFLNY